MNICPLCQTRYGEELIRCPADAQELLWFDDSDPACGQVLHGSYLVLEPLGRGGMGVVYLAWQLGTRREVALKLLTPAGEDREEQQRRFLREVHATAGLRDPHTVRIHDAGVLPDGTLFMAMERLTGPTLHQLVHAEGPLAPERVRRLGLQICASLEEAHHGQLVHRDLKPANVIVETDLHGAEQARVLDFGIAKVLSESATLLTAEGAVLGTPSYMSPEQVLGEPVGPTSDIYSLGVVLFELACKQRPFEATQPHTVMFRHVHDPPPRLRELLPVTPEYEALDAIIQRCLAKKPEDRYPTVGLLREALQGLAVPASREPAGDEVPGPRRRTPTLLYVGLGGALALVILVVGLVWGLRGPGGPVLEPLPGAPDVGARRALDAEVSRPAAPDASAGVAPRVPDATLAAAPAPTAPRTDRPTRVRPAPAVAPAPAARPVRGATYRLGAPSIIGGLDAAAAAKPLAGLHARIRRCASKRSGGGALPSGKLLLMVAVDGRVTRAKIDGLVAGEAPLAACLQRAATAVVFPALTEGGFATVTVALTP